MSQVEEIKVESYDSLTSSANDMVSTMQNLNDDITYVDKYAKDLFSSDSFRGKAADYFADLWSIVNQSLYDNVSRLNQNAEVLNQMNHNYADADKKSADGIGGIQ